MTELKHSFGETARSLKKEINNKNQDLIEYGMLIFFLAIASGAFILSLNFTPPADQFPKVTSGVASFALIALLVSKIRGGAIYGESREEINIESDEVFILASTFLYALLGIAVGLVWVTPLFIAGYCKYNDWSWIRTIVFSIISVTIPLFFDNYLAVNLISGVL